MPTHEKHKNYVPRKYSTRYIRAIFRKVTKFSPYMYVDYGHIKKIYHVYFYIFINLFILL